MATLAAPPPERDAGRYTRGAIWFHWTIAALVIANLVIGLFHDAIGGMALHKAIGITVLALSLGRWAWRLSHRPPPPPAGEPGWRIGLAHAVHWTFYLLIVLMPLSGWWMVSASTKRYPLDWFGLFPIPYLPVAAESPAGEAMHGFHEYAGWLFVGLVALHVAAALWHHLALRDGVLRRMWPGLPQPGA